MRDLAMDSGKRWELIEKDCGASLNCRNAPQSAYLEYRLSVVGYVATAVEDLLPFNTASPVTPLP